MLTAQMRLVLLTAALLLIILGVAGGQLSVAPTEAAQHPEANLAVSVEYRDYQTAGQYMVLTVTNPGNATAYDVTVDINASEVCPAKSDTPDELYEVIIPLRVYAQGNRVLSERTLSR